MNRPQVRLVVRRLAAGLPKRYASDTIALYVIDRGKAFVKRSVGASKTSPTATTARAYPITSSLLAITRRFGSNKLINETTTNMQLPKTMNDASQTVQLIVAPNRGEG